MNLDELFEQKGEVAKSVLEELEKVTGCFCQIVIDCLRSSFFNENCMSCRIMAFFPVLFLPVILCIVLLHSVL